MKKKTYTYALDLSLNSTGVCIFTNDGGFITALTIDTHSQKETRLKLEIIGKGFINLISMYPPEIVIIEQGFTLFNASTQAIFRVHGLANYLFAQYEQIYYPASTVKKVVGGRGNMTKEELRDVILKENPDISFSSLDESDAFAVGKTYFIKRGENNAKENNTKKNNKSRVNRTD